MTGKSNDLESTSGNEIKYKGVRKRKWGKWVSEIRLPNSRERIWLGSYDSPEKAARAFDAAQFCLRGPSANFNFPNNPPDIAGGRSMTPAEIQAAASHYANAPAEDPTRRQAEDMEVDEEESCSPSISDEPAVQMESTEAVRVESSLYSQMGLNGGFGSGNFASEFGLYSGFDEFTAGEYYIPPPPNFDYGGDHDNYDASFYQESSLWNF